jgi:hypothetical protein
LHQQNIGGILMSFFSRGSNKDGNIGNRGDRGRRGRMPNVLWKPLRHKKTRFSIHFDAIYEEFHQLIQIGRLNLGGQPACSQPPSPPNVILQPHHNIMHDPVPSVQPENDGWGYTIVKAPSGISQWPNDAPLPPLHPIHTTPPVSTSSMAHSLPPKDQKVPPCDSQLDKGKKQVTSLSTRKSSSSAHSRLKSTKENNSKREINLNDMHPEIEKFEEKKSQYEDFLKEREECFKNKFPRLF